MDAVPGGLWNLHLAHGKKILMLCNVSGATIAGDAHWLAAVAGVGGILASYLLAFDTMRKRTGTYDGRQMQCSSLVEEQRD